MGSFKAINYKEALVNLDIKGDILGLDKYYFKRKA